MAILIWALSSLGQGLSAMHTEKKRFKLGSLTSEESDFTLLDQTPDNVYMLKSFAMGKCLLPPEMYFHWRILNILYSQSDMLTDAERALCAAVRCKENYSGSYHKEVWRTEQHKPLVNCPQKTLSGSHPRGQTQKRNQVWQELFDSERICLLGRYYWYFYLPVQGAGRMIR